MKSFLIPKHIKKFETTKDCQTLQISKHGRIYRDDEWFFRIPVIGWIADWIMFWIKRPKLSEETLELIDADFIASFPPYDAEDDNKIKWIK